jgi:hypothetical protein
MSTPRFANLPLSRLDRLAAVLLLTLAAVLVPAAMARAEGISVTNTEDHGTGSLREAIAKANLSPGADTVAFAPGVTGTIELETALPEIESDMEIAGPGQSALTVRRAVAAPFRIFTIGNRSVSISAMTVSNGKAENGAGVDSQGALTLDHITLSGNEVAGEFASGGAIYIPDGTGPLILRESIIAGNVARASAASRARASGAGVAAFSGGLIFRSTISNNTAEASAPTGSVGVLGAGVILEGIVGSAIEQSTISGNVARTGGGSTETVVEGGGAFTNGVTITGSTIVANSAEASKVTGANLFNFHIASLPDTTVRDSIIAGPSGGSSCGGVVVSEGFNVEDGTSCGFTQASDHSGVNPGLAPNLADNGGPTPTYALLPNSIAIDQGRAFGATADQRGMQRPIDLGSIANAPGGDGSDIGAFEASAASPRDTRPPNTRISHGPARRSTRHLARFRFSSTEAGSRFQCKLDRAPFRRCTSPFRHRVKTGRHVFEVRAIDAAGNVDRTPARYVWRVQARRRAA